MSNYMLLGGFEYWFLEIQNILFLKFSKSGKMDFHALLSFLSIFLSSSLCVCVLWVCESEKELRLETMLANPLAAVWGNTKKLKIKIKKNKIVQSIIYIRNRNKEEKLWLETKSFSSYAEWRNWNKKEEGSLVAYQCSLLCEEQSICRRKDLNLGTHN